MQSKIAGLALAAAMLAPVATHAQQVVMIGEPNWPGARIIANLIREVIVTKLGGESELIPGSTPAIFAAMDAGKGDIDVHPDIWLPNQAALATEYSEVKGTVALSEGYYEGRSGFCVPTFIAEEHNIRSVFDLATPEAQAIFDFDGDGMGEIWVGAAGWNSANIKRIRVRDYGIDPFLTATTEDEAVFYVKLKQAMEEKRGAVFYCYTPHYVHNLYDVTMLEEPPYDPAKYHIVQPNESANWYEESYATTAGPVRTVHVVYSRSLEQRAPEVAEFLRRIDLDAEAISLMTYEMVINNRDSGEVAREWIAANPDTVEVWLGTQ